MTYCQKRETMTTFFTTTDIKAIGIFYTKAFSFTAGNNYEVTGAHVWYYPDRDLLVVSTYCTNEYGSTYFNDDTMTVYFSSLPIEWRLWVIRHC